MTRADRRYVAFTVGAFALLGLVALGVYLYRPLRLRYAMYRLRVLTPGAPPPKYEEFSGWLDECADAALSGNRQAIDLLLDMSNDILPCDELVYHMAAKQPELFCEILNRKPDQQVLVILTQLASSTEMYYLVGDTYNPMDRPMKRSPAELAARFDVSGYAQKAKFLVPRRGDCPTDGKRAEACRVARAALTFTRRRFAKELAEKKPPLP